jgi:hypothetical protein
LTRRSSTSMNGLSSSSRGSSTSTNGSSTSSRGSSTLTNGSSTSSEARRPCRDSRRARREAHRGRREAEISDVTQRLQRPELLRTQRCIRAGRLDHASIRVMDHRTKGTESFSPPSQPMTLRGLLEILSHEVSPDPDFARDLEAIQQQAGCLESPSWPSPPASLPAAHPTSGRGERRPRRRPRHP